MILKSKVKLVLVGPSMDIYNSLQTTPHECGKSFTILLVMFFMLASEKIKDFRSGAILIVEDANTPINPPTIRSLMLWLTATLSEPALALLSF